MNPGRDRCLVTYVRCPVLQVLQASEPDLHDTQWASDGFVLI